MAKRSESGLSRRSFERAFMLRMWREAGREAPGTLRGSILDLASGRRFYFTELGDLKDFLRQTLDKPEK
jgi:hypothetical protein